MKIGIIGLGHVGSTMKELFTDAVVYDEPKKIGSREAVNQCELAFVCVPTPMGDWGRCDTSIVEDVLSWLTANTIVLRSTLPVGFTDEYSRKLGKRILFMPEYYGETVSHPFANPRERTWITIGGKRADADSVICAYQRVFTSELIINVVTARTAELAKYMENAFLATKVVFCNEFYDIAQRMDIDYNELRETWLLDPRIGRSHTFVYADDRGYGGPCLPKDVASIIWQADTVGADITLVRAVEEKNRKYISCKDQRGKKLQTGDNI